MRSAMMSVLPAIAVRLQNSNMKLLFKRALRWIEFLLSGVLYFGRVRFVRLTAPGRIGHLASEPDAFVKEGMLGLRPWCKGILLCPKGAAANEALLDYWRRYLWVISSPTLYRAFIRFRRFDYLEYDASRFMVAINQTAPYMAIQSTWGRRPSLLRLKEDHLRRGRDRLAALGVPEGAEFVCIHCRERGYSADDDDMHAYRNASVANYIAAVEPLLGKGIWCIRMGDPSMQRLQPRERVIDYAHSDIRADWMDVFLCGTCTFLLGSSSGLTFLANVFGRPTGLANHVPLSAVLAAGSDDVAIPMLLWSEGEDRYLTFAEAFGSDVANFRFSNLYQERGIRTVENSAEDIAALAREMLERARGQAIYGPEDEELQRRFKALMRPGHYSYGGPARVGRDFLRKYEHLMGDRAG